MDDKPIWEDKIVQLMVILFIIGFGMVLYAQPFLDEWGGHNPDWREHYNVEDEYHIYLAIRTIGALLIALTIIILLMKILEISRKSYMNRQSLKQSLQQQSIRQPKVKICKNCYAVLGIDLNECPYCGLKNI